jgi:hypothetical protein
MQYAATDELWTCFLLSVFLVRFRWFNFGVFGEFWISPQPDLCSSIRWYSCYGWIPLR